MIEAVGKGGEAEEVEGNGTGSKEQGTGGRHRRTAILACGPQGMVKAVEVVGYDLGCDVHVETFFV